MNEKKKHWFLVYSGFCCHKDGGDDFQTLYMELLLIFNNIHLPKTNIDSFAHQTIIELLICPDTTMYSGLKKEPIRVCL